MAIDTKKASEFAALYRQKQELKSAMATIDDKLKAMEASLLEDFMAEGVKSVDLDGSKVYLSSQTWARLDKQNLCGEMGMSDDEAMALACTKLGRAHMGEFVRKSFNTHSLSKHFRDELQSIEAEGRVVENLEDLLPPSLRGIIAITEDQHIKVAKGRNK